MSEIIEKVRELSAVKAQIAKLNERKKELEAYFSSNAETRTLQTPNTSPIHMPTRKVRRR